MMLNFFQSLLMSHDLFCSRNLHHSRLNSDHLADVANLGQPTAALEAPPFAGANAA